MQELLFLIIIAVFFFMSVGLIKLCQRLMQD